MHPEALAYVARVSRRHGPFERVLDFGGRDVNGTPRLLFPTSEYVAVDIIVGPGVDVVADAADYHDPGADLVLCCELFEHIPNSDAVVKSAWRNLVGGGRLIITTACPPRAPHSGIDGGPLQSGEYYANVDPDDLAEWLDGWDDVDISIYRDRGDIYATAVRS